MAFECVFLRVMHLANSIGARCNSLKLDFGLRKLIQIGAYIKCDIIIWSVNRGIFNDYLGVI